MLVFLLLCLLYITEYSCLCCCALNMSQKRNPDDSKAQSERDPDDKRRKVPTFHTVVLDAVRKNYVEKFLEPMIRRVVKEELELTMKKYCSSIKQNIQDDGEEKVFPQPRVLQLKFVNTLSLPIYTGARIGGVDNSSLKIALVNVLTGKYVDFEPESSAKVEILVLEGDFDGDDCDSWTYEEFCNNILREREGRKPLLSGDVLLNLKDGTGLVGDICFTDNSSWTRSRRFRLGARVVDKCPRNRIREAKTEPFIVRDHRGELYKKHHPPTLSDEVWRLEKIGKDGAFHRRLSQENVNTVKDFLKLFFIDRDKLRRILGTGMSSKMWEVTVEHAQTCLLDKMMYLYYPQFTPEKAGVIFNVVGQVTGIVSNGEHVSIDNLSEAKKLDAHNSIISAFDNWDRVIPYEDGSSRVDISSSSHRTESSHGSKFLTNQKMEFDERSMSHYLSEISSSMYSSVSEKFTSNIDLEFGHLTEATGRSLEDYAWEESIDFEYGQSSNLSNEVNTSHMIGFDQLEFLETDVENLEFRAEGGVMNQSKRHQMQQRAKKRWRKLKSVLQWLFSRKKFSES